MTKSNTAALSSQPPMPWILIAATCFATFAITASGTTRAPFLTHMAQDLDVGLGVIANLFGLTSIAWRALTAAS